MGSVGTEVSVVGGAAFSGTHSPKTYQREYIDQSKWKRVQPYDATRPGYSFVTVPLGSGHTTDPDPGPRMRGPN